MIKFNLRKNSLPRLVLASLVSFLLGCSPEVGSIDWCEQLKHKPTRDWSEQELKAYSESCLYYKY